MFQQILVPLDNSKRSEEVFDIVSAMSQKEGVDLLLLEVLESIPPLHSGEVSMEMLKAVGTRQEADIAALLQADERLNLNRYRVLVEEGHPIPKICEVAEREAVDLIALSSHGYTGLEKFILGSVTEKVIRRAPCPVLAVKNKTVPSHILIALDGTPAAESVVLPAVTLADQLDARITITLIRHKDDFMDAERLKQMAQEDPQAYEFVLLANERGVDAYINKMVNEIEASLAAEVDYVIEYGDPAAKILDVAHERGCDLIAMSTHGRMGVERLRKGSITEEVFEQSEWPMLITHTHAA